MFSFCNSSVYSGSLFAFPAYGHHTARRGPLNFGNSFSGIIPLFAFFWKKFVVFFLINSVLQDYLEFSELFHGNQPKFDHSAN